MGAIDDPLDDFYVFLKRMCEASIMTDFVPHSTDFWISSSDSWWSRWDAIGIEYRLARCRQSLACRPTPRIWEQLTLPIMYSKETNVPLFFMPKFLHCLLFVFFCRLRIPHNHLGRSMSAHRLNHDNVLVIPHQSGDEGMSQSMGIYLIFSQQILDPEFDSY